MDLHSDNLVAGVRCLVHSQNSLRPVPYVGRNIRLLGDSTAKIDGHEKHISSFQAFTISLASRVGTGNLAGVATAITVGSPGAVFWMWIIALLGSGSAFVESSLAQLFKVRGEHSYVGRPAYYMERRLKKRWMGVLLP